MIDRPWATQANIDEQTWRMLWTHVASRVVSDSALAQVYEPLSTGIGFGLRHPAIPRRALLLHPAGQDRDVGDLALTVLGAGTQVLPRCGRDFARYVEEVTDIFETAAASYFEA